MPTARELLEQADALMRRNRSRDLEPDIPELTEEVRLTGISPVPRRLARGSRSERSEPYISGDVPELTDAIGEIEEVSIDPLPDADGEDSRWPEADMGEASITGPAPDSVVVVPPAPQRTTPERTKDPTPTNAIRIAGDGIPAAHPMSPPASPAAAPPSAAVESNEHLAHVAPELSADKPTAVDAGADAGLAEMPAESAFEQEFPGREISSAASAGVAPGLAGSEPVILPAEAEFEQEFQRVEPPVEDSVPVIAAVADGGRPVIGDDARWATMAEDIRMQVLQRIDIFTDTALSGELSTRLQPIVDRASADLLETINRQVGQLLRAYVAEAIEREIEKWREGNS